MTEALDLTSAREVAGDRSTITHISWEAPIKSVGFIEYLIFSSRANIFPANIQLLAWLSVQNAASYVS